MRLTDEEFTELVTEALADIPKPLRPFMSELIVDIESMPDKLACDSAGIGNPRTLLGLYRGTPLTERSVEQGMRLPDHITIYQHNIERMCRTRRQVVQQIRKTVLHEVGHHFGLTEEDLAQLGFD